MNVRMNIIIWYVDLKWVPEVPGHRTQRNSLHDPSIQISTNIAHSPSQANLSEPEVQAHTWRARHVSAWLGDSLCCSVVPLDPGGWKGLRWPREPTRRALLYILQTAEPRPRFWPRPWPTTPGFPAWDPQTALGRQWRPLSVGIQYEPLATSVVPRSRRTPAPLSAASGRRKMEAAVVADG